MLAASIALYGVPATFRLSLPLTGVEIYRAANNGFFTGSGRGFWYFPGVHPGYYFGTVVAFWFAASVVLIAGGCSSAFAVFASFRNREGTIPRARAHTLLRPSARRLHHTIFRQQQLLDILPLSVGDGSRGDDTVVNVL